MLVKHLSFFCLLLILLTLPMPASSQGWTVQPGIAKPASSKGWTVQPDTAKPATTADEDSEEETADETDIDDDNSDDIEKDSPIAPGEWKILLDMNNEIYPSWLLSTAGMKSEEPNEENELGDPFGSIGIMVCSPKDNCSVNLTISSANILRPSKFQAVLKKSGITYFVRPSLDFDYNTLAEVTQPFPENIKVSVSIDGKPATEKLETVNVRAVNDCISSYPDEDGNPIEVNWTFAAYINENHPEIHRIMSEAKDADGNPMTFAAYQGDKETVLAEVESIWNALERRGLRYSSITTPSLAENAVYSQFVRRVGEVLATEQANCVDGSVLMASILRRMGLDVYLIVLPEHMFLAIKLEEDDDDDDVTSLKELTGIETTELGAGSFEDALSSGEEQMKEIARDLKAALKDENMAAEGCAVVDIANARSNGVLPLREPNAK